MVIDIIMLVWNQVTVTMVIFQGRLQSLLYCDKDTDELQVFVDNGEADYS